MKTNAILFIVILILAAFGFWQYQKAQDLKITESIMNHNIEALNDTIRIEKNKEGQIEFTKQAFIAKSNDLEKWNKELAAEVKKEKGTVIFLQKSLAGIDNTPKEPKIITNEVKVHEFDAEQYTITTNSDTTFNADNFRKISIETTVKLDSSRIKWSTSKITKDALSFNLITGLKEEDGKLRIMLRSDYPNLVFSKIDGALIDPHKSEVLKKMFPPKKWGFGPVVGYGLATDMKPSYFIGVGIQYNIIRW
jgi:hypothetical protein